jgi:predicted RNA binding protein YcfA (HicA-like mRNA interferase family)
VNKTAFLKALKKRGIVFERHGANHDIFIHKDSGKTIPVPRHSEFSNELLRIILKEIPED